MANERAKSEARQQSLRKELELESTKFETAQQAKNEVLGVILIRT